MASKNLTLLDKNHPGSGNFPCTHPDQCAVRMGIALKKSGISLNSFSGIYCWECKGESHVMRAEELANWMVKEKKIFGEVNKKIKSHIDIKGKNGIIFFKDGWGAGDHIDLWDGNQLKTGDLNYFTKAKQLWFWVINN